MRFIWTVFTIILILPLALGACAPALEGPESGGQTPPRSTETPKSTATEAATEAPPLPAAVTGETAGLAEGLQTKGASVRPAAAVDQPFFSVEGRILLVGEAQVQVFEYEDEAHRSAESSAIAQDGSAIGTTKVSWAGQPNFWANGKLIVLYVGQDPAVLRLLNSVLGEPVTPHSAFPARTLQATRLPATQAPGNSTPSGPRPAAVEAAVQHLNQLLSLPTDSVQVVSYEQARWPDSCLGLSSPDEMCLQVITPGWLVILNADGVDYEIHTDESGHRVRLMPLAFPRR